MKSLKRPLVKILMTAVCWGAVISPAQAWWETGHMTLAQIAYNELTPEAKAEADRLIAFLDNAEPNTARRHFVPASVWMDEVKARGLRTFNRWHYINIPYNPEGLGVIPDAKEINVATMLSKLIGTLKSKKAGDFEKAFALRMVLHLAGDIHQPFHAVGKISEKHPKGDLGGNRTHVKSPGVKNIHALWDSTAGLLENGKADKWKDKIPGYATMLSKDYPRKSFENMLDSKPNDWAKESYKLAVKYGYGPLPADGKIDATYKRNAQRIIGERLALGGYRLAYLLNNVLK